ncbi:hypothetical protein B0H13DRAFT_2311857 [Mycena leptocephala]|nr:hypothetical protein B0H13DRAFT_2311857 [Mycena leptocephala]
MSDGSSMASDSPWSVSARTLLSQNLCMGGISVFRGLLPKVDAIVASMSIESLDSSGYLRDAQDEVAGQLASDYPFLNAHDTYHILLLAALQIQSQISNRLRLFLTESELASDGFNLYKTWEGKAANYNLANITGTGNKYWHCEVLGRKVKCPGTIIEHSSIARPSPHLSGYDKVEWFLDDADGFKTSECHQWDPYDPPENCRTEWFGLRLINPDTFFPNPVDTINNFVQSTDNSVTQFTDLAATLDPDPGPLMTLLETIANIIGYIQEVKHDQAVQKIADQAHARVSVLKIFENIGLVLLGFVPGVGEISDIVLGGWDTFSLISKAMDVASLAKTLDKDSEIFKILGIGLRAEEEVAGASEATEEAMSVEAVATRGKLGSSFKFPSICDGRLQTWFHSSIPCSAIISSKHPFCDQFNRLAEEAPYLPTSSEESPKCRVVSFQNPDLKIAGANHINSCNSSSSQMAVPNDLTEPTSSSTMTFNQCFEQHAGLCQCDHLVEPDELLRYVKSSKLSPTDKKAGHGEILNADENFAGLFGDDKAGGKFNPKSIKSTLLKNFKNPATLMNMYQKYSADGQNLMYNIVADHLTGSSDARAAIGDKLDAKLHDYFTEIDHSGTAAQKAAMAKIYVPDDPSIVKSTMGAFIKSGAANAIRIMRVFSNDTESAMPEEDPDDDSKHAGDTEEEKKSKPKPARTAAQDEACGGSGKKKAKIRAVNCVQSAFWILPIQRFCLE